MKLLERLKKTLIQERRLSAVILTGFTYDIVEALSSYLDQTNDVQTAAILAALADPFLQNEDASKNLKRMIKAYESLLNRLKYWEERAIFTTQRKLMKKAFVGNKITTEEVKVESETPRGTALFSKKLYNPICKFCGNEKREEDENDKEDILINNCPECKNELMHCSVCQYPFGHVTLVKQSWFITCDKCKHGGHMDHLKTWFERHNLCPAPGCDCECCSEESI